MATFFNFKVTGRLPLPLKFNSHMSVTVPLDQLESSIKEKGLVCMGDNWYIASDTKFAADIGLGYLIYARDVGRERVKLTFFNWLSEEYDYLKAGDSYE